MAAGRLSQFERVDVISDRGRILAGLAPDITPGEFDDLVRRTVSPEFDSVFIAAVDGTEIAGIVCFMPHRLSWASDAILTYQAAGVLTSSRYRGRGIFPDIVKHFEEVIGQSRSMIFGFPNENAYPIWTGKLGYQAIKCHKWKLPLGGGIAPLFLRRRAASPDAIYQNDRELIALKRRLYGEALLHAEDGDGYVWGVGRARKVKGVELHEFALGGARFKDGHHFLDLVSRAASKIGFPKYLSATGVESSPLGSVFKRGKASGLEHEVVIFKTFNFDIGDRPLAIYNGVTDWF